MNKLLFFIFLTVLLLIIVISVFSVLNQKRPINIPSPIPTPTPFTTEKITRISNKALLTYPASQYLQSLSVVTPLIFEFSDNIDPISVTYRITPEIDVETRVDETGKKLTFSPERFWIPNTPYTLVLEEIKSEQGVFLINNYSLKFRALNTPDEISSDAEVNNQPNNPTPAP
ncbi:MAG: hypothetical protein HY429_02670 [Candidatus Levybacteria bacterium]|nr:hypothetical protein [Candidatus Levybacteria bacterium]